MAPTRSADEQFSYLTDGIDALLPKGELLDRLAEGHALRIKLGVDPTAPDVTLGWAVVFRLLRKFQELGHVAVLIIGDFTAQVGDPSARSETRKRLGVGEVDGYVSSLIDTIKSLLLADNLEVRYNSEWLGHMDMSDVLDLTSKFTVSRIMDRDDFSKRWAAHQPISMIEFMYPLLQATDTVAVEADIEIGGSDQLFNLLVGRDLQERSGQRPQLVMTVPLIVGTDGEKKMSQSLGNYISVVDDPAEMFGKTMSIPDSAMPSWFQLAAGWPGDRVSEITEGLSTGVVHPGDAKRLLAREIVSLYYSAEAAIGAEKAFDRIFRDHGAPDVIAEHPLDGGETQALPALLTAAGVVKSRSDGRRMLTQGAVQIDGSRVTDEVVPTARLSGAVVQVGKRRFVRFVLPDPS
jgi:tyrosyl-tRNA synthetase